MKRERFLEGKGGGMIERESDQRSFHSVLWATLLPEDHELLRIERAFNFEWVDAELAKYYEARGPGRPAVSPRKMFLMMFLEMYEGLSDYLMRGRVGVLRQAQGRMVRA